VTCDLCFTKSFHSSTNFGLRLCIACIDELGELTCSELDSSSLTWTTPECRSLTKIDSLFWYSSMVRTLIIAAKAKGDLSALNRMLQIWSGEIEGKISFAEITSVMPCPSSLWSRMHGRIDIAWFLAAKISNRYKIKFIRSPRRIHWNIKKRSQTIRPLDQNLLTSDSTTHSIAPLKGEHHCLIIDDVVTTGATIKNCIEHASKLGIGRFSSLTFARAR
jgi:predicted amidophosphoribosyltransferase